MTPKEILDITKRFFEEKLLDLEKRIQRKLLSINVKYSYPNFIRLGETPTQYIIELLGSTAIDVKKGYQISIPNSSEKYNEATGFINFGRRNKIDQAIFVFDDVSNCRLSTLTLATPYDKQLFKEKINFELNPTKINFPSNPDTFIKISLKANKIILENLDLIQADNLTIFFKKISLIIIVQKNTKKEDYLSWLTNEWVKQLVGLRTALGMNIGCTSEINKFATDLLGLTSQDISEKIIDEFISKHKYFFCKALGYVDVASQPKLLLINQNGFNTNDEFLKPDYLLKRSDGNYDILDLKKSLVLENSLIKGKKKE